MRILLDTNVLSELRRPKPNPRAVENLMAFDPDNIYLSSITIGEFVYGIDRLPKSKKRTELERWLLGIEQMYAGRILSFETETAHIWGELMSKAQRKGRTIRDLDARVL